MTHLPLEPLKLLEKPARLPPRAEAHLLFYQAPSCRTLVAPAHRHGAIRFDGNIFASARRFS